MPTMPSIASNVHGNVSNMAYCESCRATCHEVAFDDDNIGDNDIDDGDSDHGGPLSSSSRSRNDLKQKRKSKNYL